MHMKIQSHVIPLINSHDKIFISVMCTMCSLCNQWDVLQFDSNNTIQVHIIFTWFAAFICN